jgi:hypothetical protein
MENAMIKCINYNICNGTDILYRNICYNCYVYFNRKLISNENKENDTCPLCLNDDEKIILVKLKNCNHKICKNCIIDIYFNKDYLNNLPKNPILKLNNCWNQFMISYKSNYYKRYILNEINNRELNNRDYIKYLFNISRIIKIPRIFKKNILELTIYQINLNLYIEDHEINKKNKISKLEKCPYCRIDN